MSIGSFVEERIADAVLPGSGEALSIWHRIKPALPYILSVVAVLIAAFLIWRAPWAESRQKAADYARFQPKLDEALRIEKVALASLTGADTAMRQQSASIRRLAADEAAKLATAQRLIAEAHKLAAQRQSAIDALHASAAKPLPGPPCEASDTAKGLWQ